MRMNLSRFLGHTLERLRHDEPLGLPTAEAQARVSLSFSRQDFPAASVFVVLADIHEALKRLDTLSARKAKEQALGIFRSVSAVCPAALENMRFVHRGLVSLPADTATHALDSELLFDASRAALKYLGFHGYKPHDCQTAAKAALWAGVAGAYQGNAPACRLYMNLARSNSQMDHWIGAHLGKSSVSLLQHRCISEALDAQALLAI